VILPLGDAPNPRGVPVVTYALMAANIAVYVFLTIPLGAVRPDPSDPLLPDYLRMVVGTMRGPVRVDQLLAHVSAYDLFVFRYGFRPAEPHLANLFYSMFLHAGLAHLAGNMLFLWIYGDNVEHRLGSLRYLLAYLATGVAAIGFHSLFAGRSPLPLLGASGAISGLLGFYFLWFPRNRVRLLFFLFPFFMDVITVPARVLLGLYLVVDNLLPFLFGGAGGGGVAHGAHIGGFLGGLGLAWWLDRREIGKRPREYRPPRTGASAALPAERIRDALGEGDFPRAAAAYFALEPSATRRILTAGQSSALAEWLRRNGHEDAALVVYRRHLRDYPNGPGAAEAHLGAGLIQLERLGQATSAYQHFLDALELDPSAATAAEVRAALAVIEARQKSRIGGGGS